MTKTETEKAEKRRGRPRKADITAKRDRTCGIGDCNVSCHSFCDG